MELQFDDRSEWLEADGLGGFASGTVSGVRTRRYHALLLSATTPPTGRIVLVNGFEAWVEAAAGSVAITTHRYAPDVLHPDGASRIVNFATEPWPTWEFDLPGGIRLRQEIFVQHGAGATVVAWTVLAADESFELKMRPLLSGRDYHSTHHENGTFRFDADLAGASVAFHPYDGVASVIALSNGDYQHAPEWYRNFLYREERERGLDAAEDLASPGIFRWMLVQAGDCAVWIVKAGADADNREARSQREVERIYERQRTSELDRRHTFPSPVDRATDAYLVQRGSGRTIVAGYPWFTDWGRDTFIAIRGLCIATGRLADARGRDAFVARFFDDRTGSLADVIDVDHVSGTRDDTCRPNQILAIGGLPLSLLDRDRARRVVDVVERRLLTPLGLRSLAPDEPGYAAHYVGDSSARDAVYHQGTVWPWLLGPFVEAWIRVRGNTAAAKQSARTRFLEPLREHLATAGLGHISEIADAEPPFTPRGCPFQAWSLGEFVRLDRAVLATRTSSSPHRVKEPQWA